MGVFWVMIGVQRKMVFSLAEFVDFLVIFYERNPVFRNYMVPAIVMMKLRRHKSSHAL